MDNSCKTKKYIVCQRRFNEHILNLNAIGRVLNGTVLKNQQNTQPMKKVILLFLLLFEAALLAQGQTIVRFKPEVSTISLPEKGKIEQIGHDFTQMLRIELPHKTLRLNLTPSRLKQYQILYTSEGEQPSRAELFEAIDNNQKYYITTINRQFHGLLMLEDGHLVTLEKTKDSLFTFQKIISGEHSGISCAQNQVNHPAFSPARAHAPLLSGCFEFPIAFVCDYAHYHFFGEKISEIEADNLLKLAAAQETWSPYAFNAEIVFKAIGQLIFTNNDTPPWSLDGTRALGTLWGELNNSWEKPKEWKKYKSLIVTGVTGINYGSTPGELLTWGYGGTGQNEFSLGTILMKGFLGKPQSKWLFAHELGHVFGAGHDEEGGYVMQSTYSGNSWSPRSKSSINGTLDNLESKKLLKQCSTLILSYELSKDSLTFGWTTNYIAADDFFAVEYSQDEQKTWLGLGQIASTGSFSYKYRSVNKLPLGQVTYFRVRQQGMNLITSNVLTVSITGIAPESSIEDAVVYPNPFTNQLTVKNLTSRSISVYDQTGKLIQRVNISKPYFQIDTSSWASGIYFIQPEENDSKVYKIVK